jgi:hypothetical protein
LSMVLSHRGPGVLQMLTNILQLKDRHMLTMNKYFADSNY